MVERVKLVYGNGFQIASHTWSHPHLPTLTIGIKVSRLVFFFRFCQMVITIHFSVNLEMQQSEGMRVFSELGFLTISDLSIDAIFKITGARVAFTRPRFFFVAYSEYNDVTISVANARNQKLITWDFEYATVSWFAA
jgi:hypothetical protein